MRARYKKQLSLITRARWREPHILFVYAVKMAMHYHYVGLTHALTPTGAHGEVMPTAGRSFSRAKRRVEERAVA